MGFVEETNYHFVERLNVSQKAPSRLKPAVHKFHAKLLRERKCGTFVLSDIANMDQTPLPFVLDDGKTYDGKDSGEFWFSSGKSGVDKKHSAIQLTVFADGIPRVRPTMIFRGDDKCINPF